MSISPPVGWDQILVFYGGLPERDATGHISLSWQLANLVTFETPFPLELAWDGPVSRLRCHRKVEASISAALLAVRDAGLGLWLGQDYGGCFADRGKRTNPKQLSMHAFGAAFDFRIDTNVQGAEPEAGMQQVAEIMAKFGLTWGGNFSVPDGMHFQLGSNY